MEKSLNFIRKFVYEPCKLFKPLMSTHEKALRWMQQNTLADNATLVLVMACFNKPLSEPMLAEIYVAICRHRGTMS